MLQRTGCLAIPATSTFSVVNFNSSFHLVFLVDSIYKIYIQDYFFKPLGSKPPYPALTDRSVSFLSSSDRRARFISLSPADRRKNQNHVFIF